MITDPGDEIKAITVRTIPNFSTPFAVEYARSSGGRGGAPTLVPVTTGGAPVQACIYEVDTDEKTACDILYRWEIGEVGGGKTYKPPEPGNLKKVGIEKFVGLGNMHVVLSTKLVPTISPLDAATLADLAIASAQSIDDGRDGISYLLNATTSGINTPLTSDYVAEVVARLGAVDLPDALAKVRESTFVVHPSCSVQSPADVEQMGIKCRCDWLLIESILLDYRLSTIDYRQLRAVFLVVEADLAFARRRTTNGRIPVCHPTTRCKQSPLPIEMSTSRSRLGAETSSRMIAFFRTDPLDSGNVRYAESTIDDYAAEGSAEAAYSAYDGQETGNPAASVRSWFGSARWIIRRSSSWQERTRSRL